MRYLSDDGKVFNSEIECCEHERNVKNEERLRQEKEKKDIQTKITKLNNQLCELLTDYLSKYPYSVNDKFLNDLMGCSVYELR